MYAHHAGEWQRRLQRITGVVRTSKGASHFFFFLCLFYITGTVVLRPLRLNNGTPTLTVTTHSEVLPF